MIVSLVLLAWCLGSVVVAALQARKAADRIRLIALTANTLAVLAIARALAPWPGASGWGWMVSAWGFSAMLVLVTYRWPGLPSHPEEASGKKRRWELFGALSPLALVALVGWTFL